MVSGGGCLEGFCGMGSSRDGSSSSFRLGSALLPFTKTAWYLLKEMCWIDEVREQYWTY